MPNSPYLALAGQWINSDECDSLLFSCLYAIGADTPFPVEEAYWDGLWHRRPEKCGECSSTISRDMFMGLLAYCLHFARLDILDSLWSDAKRLRGKMGIETKEPEEVTRFGLTFRVANNRVWWTPGIWFLVGEIRSFLRGKHSFWSLFPQVYSTEPGYTSHLTMLHLYMNLRMRGELTSREKRVLTAISVHSPKNALCLALLGETSPDSILAAWPLDRTPDSSDWQEEWRTQRHDDDPNLAPSVGIINIGLPQDTDSNLLPSSSAPLRVHSGGDYLFVRHVLGLHKH